jgi:hypothetical protein
LLTNDIQKKCDKLVDQHREMRKFLIPAKICGAIFLILGLGFIITFGEEYQSYQYIGELTWVFGLLSLFMLIIAFGLFVFALEYDLDDNELIVLYTYATYRILDDYHNRSKFSPRLKKARSELEKMSTKCTDEWSSTNTSLISKNVAGLSSFMTAMEKVSSVVDNDKHLYNFQEEFLVDMINFSFGHGEDTFETMDKKLRKFVIIEEIKIIDTEKIGKFLNKYPVMKYSWIPPLTFVIIFGILHNVDPSQLHGSLTAAFAVSAIPTFAILFRGKFKNS